MKASRTNLYFHLAFSPTSLFFIYICLLHLHLHLHLHIFIFIFMTISEHHPSAAVLHPPGAGHAVQHIRGAREHGPLGNSSHVRINVYTYSCMYTIIFTTAQYTYTHSSSPTPNVPIITLSHNHINMHFLSTSSTGHAQVNMT